MRSKDSESSLQKRVLPVHGRLYISPHFLCFGASLFGHKHRVTIPIRDIKQLTDGSHEISVVSAKKK